jgi:hypothetical protein
MYDRRHEPQAPVPLGGERGWDPQHRERVRRELAHRAGHQRRERSLVGVGPVQVPAGGHEVELVAVVPRPDPRTRRTRVKVSDLEAVNGTPVVDLKPVLSADASER